MFSYASKKAKSAQVLLTAKNHKNFCKTCLYFSNVIFIKSADKSDKCHRWQANMCAQCTLSIDLVEIFVEIWCQEFGHEISKVENWISLLLFSICDEKFVEVCSDFLIRKMLSKQNKHWTAFRMHLQVTSKLCDLACMGWWSN